MKTIKICIYFPPTRITKPLVYHLIKDYDLMVSILHADISLNKSGKLIADITGTKWNIERGLKFIEEQEIEYKLFSRNIIWKEDECVHCGACTSVCPSRALVMNKENWNLNFNREKCLVCGLCVKACPLNVMCITE